MQFTKVSMLRVSKGYCSPNFHPISAKLGGKYGNLGAGRSRLLPMELFFDNLPNIIYNRTLMMSGSYIAIMHKAILVSCDKWPGRALRPHMQKDKAYFLHSYNFAPA